MYVIVSTIISVVSVGFAICTGIWTVRRNTKQDNSEEAGRMATVIVKLENIGTGIAEIKADMNNVRGEQSEIKEKVIIIDQSLKSAWHQIDEIKNHIGMKGRAKNED